MMTMAASTKWKLFIENSAMDLLMIGLEVLEGIWMMMYLEFGRI